MKIEGAFTELDTTDPADVDVHAVVTVAEGLNEAAKHMSPAQFHKLASRVARLHPFIIHNGLEPKLSPTAKSMLLVYGIAT